MPRKRMIDPSIWTDEGMDELTPRQQLLYIGLFSNADDDGRLKGSASAIRLMLPTIYRAIDLNEIDQDVLAVIRVMRQLVRYEVDGRVYLAFCNYRQWQRIDKPTASTLPAPPEDSTNTPVTVGDESPNTPVALSPNRKEEKVSEEKRKEENGARLRALDLLRNYGVSTEYFENSLTAYPEFVPDIYAIALDFVTYHSKGPPKKDKDRTWLNWLKNARRFKERDEQQSNGTTRGTRPADKRGRSDPASQIGRDPDDTSADDVYLEGLSPAHRRAVAAQLAASRHSA